MSVSMVMQICCVNHDFLVVKMVMVMITLIVTAISCISDSDGLVQQWGHLLAMVISVLNGEYLSRIQKVSVGSGSDQTKRNDPTDLARLTKFKTSDDVTKFLAQLAFSTSSYSLHTMKRLQHQTPPSVADPPPELVGR